MHLHLNGSAGVRAGLLDALFCGGGRPPTPSSRGWTIGTRSTRISSFSCTAAAPVSSASPRSGRTATACTKWCEASLDWNAHGCASPFRCYDELLNLLPKGVITFLGSGITGNLVEKAAALGIPVQRVQA